MGLLIKNGTIVTASDEFVGDILVEGEKIVQLGTNIDATGHEVVDATGKYVMPGGVDEHVHMGPFDTYSFETSHAALVGGTTTIVDFSPQYPSMGVIESKDRHNRESAAGISTSDYSFHGMVMDANDDLLDEIPHMVENGIVSLKLLMGYKGTPFYSPDPLIFKSMQIAREHGITVMLHCENGEMINVLEAELAEQGETLPINHARRQPPILEDEATFRAAQLAELADCPTFVVHVTTEQSMKHIKEAHAKGTPIYGETCTHYLTLDRSYLETPDSSGNKYVCSPPLRPIENQEPLWKALAENDLIAVSSDHAAVVGGYEGTKKSQTFPHLSNGAPGVQERMTMIWTQGVEKGRISRQRFVEVTATNPAKMSGIYPQKGHLAPGADADIIILDPDFEGKISVKDSYEGTDYSAYEGFPRKGRFEKVYLRGQLMAENGEFVGEKGGGQYIQPKPYALCYDGWQKKDQII